MSAPGGVHDGKVVVAPWQSLNLDALGLTESEVQSAAYWADEDGLLRGHLAIAKALQFGGMPWSLAGFVIGKPPISWLASPVYELVAKNRHRLPGSTDACKLPG